MSDAEVMARIAPAPRPASYGGRIKLDFAHPHAELKRPSKTLMLLWRQLGSLEDLDGPLLRLVSNAPRYMTGSVLAVDGGHLVSSL
jgi:NAD(P)-dependent dehydrogenase (short-subunit alcohol dehydrogenase family)